MSKLYDLIQNAAEGNNDSTLTIIEKFQPLLKMYTYRLDYEDAYNDLLLALITMVKHFRLQEMRSTGDEFLLSYIKKSVRHSYIALSKKHKNAKKTLPITLSEYDEKDYGTKWDELSNSGDEYQQIEHEFLYNVLTKYEAEIIIYSFYLKYSVKEIAAFYKVSMPAITQAKKNAFKKLRKHYSNNIF